ncbi:odorant receptor 4-like [Bombyx mandarina]|uniref:Odorant receptor n=1 Tax=Bombyx mandarina TaxID=7092 RepID=A0A6J2JKJ4_BOMMA|nr:odorant receptor 4-like [Bombyx mandarina]
MEALKDYPVDFARSFKASLDFLSWSNIKFFAEDQTFIQRYWRLIITTPCVVLMYVTAILHICKLLYEEEIFVIAYLMPPVLVATQAILKAFVLVPNSSQVSHIMRELGNLWTRTNLTVTQSNDRAAILKKVNFCNSVIFWISMVGTLQYMTSPLLETLVRRFVMKEDCELLLPITCSYPLSPSNDWAVYIFVYAFLFYSECLCVFVYVGAELIMITLCANLGMQFTLLREDLLQLNPVANKKRGTAISSEELAIKQFVMRHQQLVELSRLLDSVFNPIIFVNLLFVGLTTCFFRYAGQFSRGPTYMLNNYVAVFSSLQFVFYLCYFGELLTGASARIGDTAYQNLWFEGGTHYQKTMLLIIRRSQRACCLTSLKYAPVTLNMFTKVISTTWSYFSLMNTVYGEQE